MMKDSTPFKVDVIVSVCFQVTFFFDALLC